MATEEDQEVFEIIDFTTATDWERFITRIEEVIHEWKLPNQFPSHSLKKGDLTNGKWEEISQEIYFADVRFTMSFHRLVLPVPSEQASPEEPIEEPLPVALGDLMAMENDFPPRAHCLARWYGLRSFIVIAPTVNTEAITSESRAKLLLSSCIIAISNTNCHIPIFIQLHQKWQKYYLGVCEGGGIRTNFEMIHLRKVPPQCHHLAGLLDIFKKKLASPVASLPPVVVSIRFTYTLQDWTHYAWPQEPPDFDSMMDDVGVSEFGKLPFGADQDPIKELHLSTTWPCLCEDVVVDNDIFSDLDPLQAPQWSVRLRTQDSDELNCLLYEYLEEFLSLSNNNDTTEQLLGRPITEDDESDINYAAPLDRLADPVRIPSMTSVVTQAKRQINTYQDEGPIPPSQIQAILFFLFPDAQTESISEEADESDDVSNFNMRSAIEEPTDPKLKEMIHSFKSAPTNGLVYKLALCLAHVNHTFGIRAVAQLWREFVWEMRYRWDITCPLPGLDPGSPNLGSCLLNQKLQMLNCCIEWKKTRESCQVQRSGRRQSLSNDDDRAYDSSSEEEFYECTEKISAISVETGDGQASSVNSNTSTEIQFCDSLSFQPEGRLRRCGNLSLLNSDEPLYIPITQEPAPMTEDLLEAHAEVLVQLGTDSEGAQLRAKMQSACLLSDMESFKAANPTCCLEDFVRWYSPRDWIEEEIGDGDTDKKAVKGHLSERMLIPGNMWQEAWDTAKAVPVRRQKRLFDDTKEAEKVLHFLSSLKPSQVIMHLMPAVIHAAFITSSQTMEPALPSLSQTLEQIAEKAANVMRAPQPQPKKYKEIIKQLEGVEILIARAQSLRTKFSNHAFLEGDATSQQAVDEFLCSLLEKPEVYVLGGSRGTVGRIIHKLFVEAQKSINLIMDDDPDISNPPKPRDRSNSYSIISTFPKAAGREYILRTTVPCPAPYSTSCPQRMYCVLQKGEVRIAGAFSQDTTFS